MKPTTPRKRPNRRSRPRSVAKPELARVRGGESKVRFKPGKILKEVLKRPLDLG